MEHAYAHHIPGRIRVRCAGLKRNPKAVVTAKVALDQMEGVISSEVNLLTGSITILYDPDRINGRAIVRVLSAQGHCSPEAAIPVLEVPSAWALVPAGTHEVAQMAPLFSPISLATVGTLLGVAGMALGKMLIGKLVEKAVERSAVALIGAIL